jgi:hypothetical protein
MPPKKREYTAASLVPLKTGILFGRAFERSSRGSCRR